MLSQTALESFKKHLNVDDLVLQISEEWGSHNPRHRELIHQQRAIFIEKSPNLHSSISHTHELGIVAFCSAPIGVDIEQTSRVHSEVVRRISSAEEFELAPSPAALWCAKEASFKALRDFAQPSVVSAISIGNWAKIDSHTETFALLNYSNFSVPLAGHGLVFQLANHTLGFFIFSA